MDLNQPQEVGVTEAVTSLPPLSTAQLSSSCPNLILCLDNATVGCDGSVDCPKRKRRQSVGDGNASGQPIFVAAATAARCQMCQSWRSEVRRLRAAQRQAEAAAAAEAASRQREANRAAELADALERLDTACRRSDAAHVEKLDDLSKQLSEASGRVNQLRDRLESCRSSLGDQLSCLIRDRDQLQDGIDQLQGWYDDLLAAGRDSADSLRQDLLEGIPAAADELQVLVLKLKEDLIAERVTREHLERRYQSEAEFERRKLLSESEQLRQTEECLQTETDRCDRLRSELARERGAKEAAQAQLANLQEKSREVAANLRSSEAELKARAGRLEADNAELRHRVTCLQTELQNSESVQKDFVELSQSLQVQLENLRLQESQVRWQFLEDAANCGACNRPLSLSVKPRRCLHCVKLFCHDCTSKTVSSGPKQRLANVCEFCHTLVVKDAVPYFSVRAPPQK